MRRRAFTLTELLVGIAVMLILAGVMTLNSSAVGRQTAKREAERVAAYIQDRMRRADMTHSAVWFTITTNEIELRTGSKYEKAEVEEPAFKASSQCKYSPTLRLVYPNNTNQNITNVGTYKYLTEHSSVTVGTGKGTYTLTVKDEDGKTCNVIIRR